MSDPQRDLDEELQFHREARIRDYLAKGMTPDAARAAASQRLGDVARVRQACASTLAAGEAAERRRSVMKVSWLDVKLGLRMLAKSPALSSVSVIGLAVAIALSAGVHVVFGALMNSKLPFDDEGRVVIIRTRALAGQSGLGAGATMHDFGQWRRQLTSIGELGGFREDTRNLITGDGRADLIDVASITASAFPLTGAAPVAGRTLLPDDETAAAPRVLVIGYDEWQGRFYGDPAVVGRSVRLDETPHTIVGVMPRGFGFPISHGYWVALRPTDHDLSAAAATSVNVFGRLVPGVSLQDAQTELTTIGARMAAALPNTHQDIRPQVQSFTRTFIGSEDPAAELELRTQQFVVGLLLLIIAVNVSILVYARTATRTGEIAVRTALGASRARVVAQLFVEALVPAIAATVLGLGLLGVAFRLFRGYLQNSTDRIPYWITGESFGITAGAVVYGLALATIAAVIIGVLPALKATRRRVQAGLQQFSARGAGLQLGRTWNALIVLQVAVAVAALPTALHNAEASFRAGVFDAPPAAVPLLRATLTMSRDLPSTAADAAAVALQTEQFTTHMTSWMERIAMEPGVDAVTYAHRFPGEEWGAAFEVQADQSRGAEALSQRPNTVRARLNRVAVNFFEVFGVRALAGRTLTAADVSAGARAVVVDEIFAEELAAGSNVLGRRLRFGRPTGDATPVASPWYEIVGVVPAFASSMAPAVPQAGGIAPRIYFASQVGADRPVTVVVQANGGEPGRLSERLRAITAAVHPTLQLQGIHSVVEAFNHGRQAFWYLSIGILTVTASVLLLSAAGIYALMSFTVAKRRREIGIRAALGADARHVLGSVFARAFAQIGAGVAVGLAVAATLDLVSGGTQLGGRALVLLPTVALVMCTVGLLAAIGPARRGLSVQPTEALRAE